MTGKLFKYDFKVVSSKLAPLYTAAIIISIVNRLILFMSSSHVKAFFSDDSTEEFSMYAATSIFFILFLYFVFFVVAAGIFIITHLIMIQRFHSSVFGNEGYLTNTLPLNSVQIIGSKFINYMIWLFLGGVTVIVTSVIAFPFEYFSFNMSKIFEYIKSFYVTQNISEFLGFLVLYFLNFIFKNTRTVVQILLSITIASLFKSYRLLLGIGAFLGLGFIITVISYFLKISFFLIDFGNSSLYHSSIYAYFFLAGSCLIEITVTVLFFFTTVYLHKNKLNLE